MKTQGRKQLGRGVPWGSILPVSIWISGADDFVQEGGGGERQPLCFSMGGRGGRLREGDARRRRGSGHVVDPVHTLVPAERSSCPNARMLGPWTRCTQVARARRVGSVT
jgi:hypothetical protein